MVGARTTRAILLAAVLAGTVATARADDAAGLVVESQPSTVSFDGRESVELLVIVRNEGERQLSDVDLSWIDDAVVEVSGSLKDVSSLPPGAAHSWELTLMAPLHPPASGSLLLRVGYRERRSSQSTVPRISTLEVDVQHPMLESAASVATVAVKTTLESLNEQRPGHVYLLVTNLLDHPLRVSEPKISAPDFVDLRYTTPGLTVEPDATGVVELEVRALSRVRPGRHLLVFEIPMAWTVDERENRVRQVITQSVEVGVFGESKVMELASVPSVLLLPGFLFVTTLLGLAKYSNRRRGIDWKPPFALKSSEFWVAAVALSIVAYIGNRWLGGHDYLASYGLVDLARLWGSSIVSAFGVAAVVLVGGWARDWLQERRSFKVGDDPITTLKKLDLRNRDMWVPMHAVEIDEQRYAVCLLEPFDSERTTVWVAPVAVYVRFEGKSEKGARALCERIEQLLVDGKPLRELAERLEIGRERSLLDVRWTTKGVLSGPREVERSKIGEAIGEPRALVESRL